MGNYSVILGGLTNSVDLESSYTFIAGQEGIATGSGCVVAGGRKNKCFSNYGTIMGGQLNKVNDNSRAFTRVDKRA